MGFIEFLILLIVFMTLFSLASPARGTTGYLPRRMRKRALKRRRHTKTKNHDTPKRTRRRNKHLTPPNRAHDAPHDVQNIWVNDIITIADHPKDFLVEERFVCREKNWEWEEFTLHDGDDTYYLSVAEEGKELMLSHKLKDLQLSYPPPETITYEGEEYHLKTSGRAESTREDNGKSEPFRYYTYQGPEEKVLTVEDWEGDFEYYLGEPLHARDLSILPGRANSEKERE